MDYIDIRHEPMDWIHLLMGRGQWQALVNMIMKLGVP
jgi:hypothetical protein